MTDIELKKITINDLKEVRKIAVQSYREHYKYLWENEAAYEWYINKSFSHESLARQFKDQDVLFFLLLLDKKSVGFCKLNVNKNIEGTYDETAAELERLYLLNEATGKGFGRQVLTHIAQQLKQNYKQVLWLKSMDSSPSVSFYIKSGFEIIASGQLPFAGLKEEYRTILTLVKKL